MAKLALCCVLGLCIAACKKPPPPPPPPIMYNLNLEVEGSGIVHLNGKAARAKQLIPANETIQLSAAPGESEIFDGWSLRGQAPKRNRTLELQIENDTNIKAVFRYPKLSLNWSGEGSVSFNNMVVSQGETLNVPRGMVSMVVNPAEGYEVSAADRVTVAGNAWSIAVEEDTELTLAFKKIPTPVPPTYELRVVQKENGRITPNNDAYDFLGQIKGHIDRFHAPEGSLISPAFQAGDGYHCHEPVAWFVDGSVEPLPQTLTKNLEIEPIYGFKNFRVEISQTTGGLVKPGPRNAMDWNGSEQPFDLQCGSTLDLVPNADDGYAFKGWYVNNKPVGAKLPKLTENMHIEAFFERMVELDVRIHGSGTVSIGPVGSNAMSYAGNVVLTFSPDTKLSIAAPDSSFDRFELNGVNPGPDDNFTFILNDHYKLHVYFDNKVRIEGCYCEKNSGFADYLVYPDGDVLKDDQDRTLNLNLENGWYLQDGMTDYRTRFLYCVIDNEEHYAFSVYCKMAKGPELARHGKRLSLEQIKSPFKPEHMAIFELEGMTYAAYPAKTRGVYVNNALVPHPAAEVTSLLWTPAENGLNLWAASRNALHRAHLKNGILSAWIREFELNGNGKAYLYQMDKSRQEFLLSQDSRGWFISRPDNSPYTKETLTTGIDGAGRFSVVHWSGSKAAVAYYSMGSDVLKITFFSFSRNRPPQKKRTIEIPFDSLPDWNSDRTSLHLIPEDVLGSKKIHLFYNRNDEHWEYRLGYLDKNGHPWGKNIDKFKGQLVDAEPHKRENNRFSFVFEQEYRAGMKTIMLE